MQQPVDSSTKAVLIVALGDSTTAGTPFFRSPLEAPPNGAGDAEGQYAYWMMRRRPQWNVLNFGVAGETTIQIHARIGDALKLGPRYLIVLAGVNDINEGIPVSQDAEHLLAMYREAKERSVLPVACTVPPFNGATPDQAKAIDDLNRWIVKAAEKLRLPIADLNAAARDPRNSHKLSASPDGMHPDVGGYRKMGQALVDALDPIEKAWR